MNNHHENGDKVGRMSYRLASLSDVPLLAELNAGLLRDGGWKRILSQDALEKRMKTWLSEDYRAVLVEQDGQYLGYALFCIEEEFTFVLQIYVVPNARRSGVGRMLLLHLQQNFWSDLPIIRLNVLAHNERAKSFYTSLGFEPYSICLEAPGIKDGSP